MQSKHWRWGAFFLQQQGRVLLQTLALLLTKGTRVAGVSAFHFFSSEEPGHYSFMTSKAGGTAGNGRPEEPIVRASNGQGPSPRKSFADLRPRSFTFFCCG